MVSKPILPDGPIWGLQPGGRADQVKVLGCTWTLLEILPGPILGPGFGAGGGIYSSQLARGCSIVLWSAPAGKLLRCWSRRVAPVLEGVKLLDMPHILLQDRLLFVSNSKPQAFCAIAVMWHLRGSWSYFWVTPEGTLSYVTWDMYGDAVGAWEGAEKMP